MYRFSYYLGLFTCTYIFLTGCSPGLQLAGSYYNATNPVSFVINNDSTFNYRYQFAFDYRYSNGSWEQRGKNKIILSSNVQSKILPLKVVESEGEDRGNTLHVDIDIPADEKSFYICSVFLNDTFFVRRRCDAISSIPVGKSISTVRFEVTTDVRLPTRSLDILQSEKYHLKAVGSRDLEIKIVYEDSLFNYKVVNQEVLKMKRKGLKFYSSPTSRWIYLPRQEEEDE